MPYTVNSSPPDMGNMRETFVVVWFLVLMSLNPAII